METEKKETALSKAKFDIKRIKRFATQKMAQYRPQKN